MCGIAGIRDRRGERDLSAYALRMSQSLTHRGPDGAGLWLDNNAGIALGHRRLAIIDLSEMGHQPMTSACGRFVITYNGELYNTEEIRAGLLQKGIEFRGRSDTEVLVNAVAVWGLEATAREIDGIYAFAVWDRQLRELSLVRDRLGVKPLFWSESNGTFLFASELRAFSALPDFDRGLDLRAVGSFLHYNYIRAPLTIYRAAQSLEAGKILKLCADGTIEEQKYWDIHSIVVEGSALRAEDREPEEAIRSLEALLSDSVRRQIVSDVPVGVFLSGGIDSSIVAAMMQKAASAPVRSFTIGFDAGGFNEAVAAKAVAASLGTDHTELYVTSSDALQCVPKLAAIYDQPLADPSGIPTYLLCKMARQHVTVALSGDGGDELFFGYARFHNAARVRNKLSAIPRLMIKCASRSLDAFGTSHMRRQGFYSPGQIAKFGWHASRLLNFASVDVNDVYLHFITHFGEPDRIAPNTPDDFEQWRSNKRAASHFEELMMLHDTVTYLPGCVLAKVDRASMAASLEARVPLLDHRLVEMAWTMPQVIKYRGGVGKWCLRELLYRYVPRELVDRPKTGFGPPLGEWLRGPLREWAEGLLAETALRDSGLIDPIAARPIWNAHLSSDIDASSHLWSLLTLQAWLAEMNATPAAAMAGAAIV